MIDWKRADELCGEVVADDFGKIIALLLEKLDDVLNLFCDGLGFEKLDKKLHFSKGSALNIGLCEFVALYQLGQIFLPQSYQVQIDII